MEAMERVLDVRGLRCPIPYARAAALMPLSPGETLVVRFTDPEAPIDLAALAADHGLVMDPGDGEVTLRRPPHPGAGLPPR